MSSNMYIYEIQWKCNEEGSHTTYYQVGDRIDDIDVIDSVTKACRQHWHLEGECGFIGELSGAEYFEVVNIPDYTHALDEDKEYRIEVSW